MSDTPSGNGLSELDEQFLEDGAIDRALEEAAAEAVEDHRRAGNPIAVWRDGRVVWIVPEDIPARNGTK